MSVARSIAVACVVAARTASADVPAEPVDDAPPGEVIVVTGTRTERPLATSPVVTEVIDRAHLEASGAETAAGALAQRPGLWIERGLGGARLSVQGLGPEYTLILVDGQRQIGRVDGAIDLDRFSVAELERIEIVRGPGSALYGADALAGVVNLVTREPDGAAVEASGRIDGRLATDTRARITGGRAGLSGSLGAEYRRGDAIDLSPEEPSTTIAAYRDARVGGRGVWTRPEEARVELGAEYLRRDLEGVDALASGAILERHNRTETASARAAAARYGEVTSAHASLGAAVFRDQYLSDQRGADALDAYEETRERLVEASAQVEHRRGRHVVTAGADGLREALDAERLSTPGARWRGGLYAQDEWHLGAAYRWLVVPAIRADGDTQFGVHVTPRIAARWDPRDDVALRASAGQGYRAPSFKELLLRFENPGVGYVVEGNPDLAPETSANLQLGVEWQPRPWLWLGVNAYDNELHDLITTVTLDDGSAGAPLRFGYDNIGRARTTGVEGSAVVERGRLALELGWAYTRARDLEADAALEGIPAQRVSAAIRWRDRDEHLDASIEAAITGRRPYYVAEDATTYAGRRADLRARVARRFDGGLGAFVGVDNLLGAGDDTFDPIPPLTLYAGLEVRR